MFVKFVSDGSVQKAGFSATFIKELDECELKDHGCQHNCINTLGGYQCSCHIGYELHSDKKTCESKYIYSNNFSHKNLAFSSALLIKLNVYFGNFRRLWWSY